MSKQSLLTVVVDSREQTPWSFGDVPCVVAGLPVGDYSIVGFESRIAIERKSLPDFVACCTRERPRFWRELEKLAGYSHAAVIIESDVSAIEAGCFVSRTKPWAVITSALAITADFRIPVIFGGDAHSSARCAFWLLRRYTERLSTSNAAKEAACHA
jgi:DNA excision repair protein ERCC-4